MAVGDLGEQVELGLVGGDAATECERDPRAEDAATRGLGKSVDLREQSGVVQRLDPQAVGNQGAAAYRRHDVADQIITHQQRARRCRVGIFKIH